MKFIKALIVGMVVAVSADANPTFLEPHQTATIVVSVPVGKSVVSVWAAGKTFATPLSCTFYDPSGNVALMQKQTLVCIGNVPKMERSEKLSVKITNEANEKVQYSLAVSPVQ